MKKIGRNDPCPCGSGKKFKKCCESTMIGGRFKATKVDGASAPQITAASRMTGLFQNRVTEAPKPHEPPKPIKMKAPEGTPPETPSENGKS